MAAEAARADNYLPEDVPAPDSQEIYLGHERSI